MDLKADRAILMARVDGVLLDGHQVPVVTQIDKLRPPCVYITLDTIEHYLSDSGTTWNVFLVAPNTDEERSIDQLQQLLELALPLFPPSEDTQFIGLQTPEQAAPLPALRIRTQL